MAENCWNTELYVAEFVDIEVPQFATAVDTPAAPPEAMEGD